jgi:hypothetical protein
VIYIFAVFLYLSDIEIVTLCFTASLVFPLD